MRIKKWGCSYDGNSIFADSNTELFEKRAPSPQTSAFCQSRQKDSRYAYSQRRLGEAERTKGDG